MLSDTDESSVIVIDDDSDVESPVIIEDGSCEEGQISSIKKEIEDFTISKHNASDDNGEQDVGEKLVNDPEAKLQISDTKMVTDEKDVAVAEQPRKRKYKGRNTCVTPGKSIQPGMLVHPSVPSPPSVPALSALPFPLGIFLVGYVLPTNLPPFQQLPGGQGGSPVERNGCLSICHCSRLECFLATLFVPRMSHFP